MLRRKLVSVLIGTGLASLSGCTNVDDDSEYVNEDDTDTGLANTPSQTESGSPKNQGNSDHTGAEGDHNEDESEATASRSEVEAELPGDPVETEGALPIQDTVHEEEYSYEGYEGDPVAINVDATARGSTDSTTLTARGHNFGTGRTTAVAVSGFVSSFKVTEPGRYRITAAVSASGFVDYEYDIDDDISISYDISLVVTDALNESVKAEVTEDILRGGSGSVSDSLDEQVIATLASLVFGKALGLKLIGRALLRQFIQVAITVQNDVERDGDTRRVEKQQSRSERILKTDIEVLSGDLVVIELDASTVVAFEHEDNWTKGWVSGDCVLNSVTIERV